MDQIRGYVELELTKNTGDVEFPTVDGAEFGLEQGGDWRRDSNLDISYASFLFIAFCDGFELHLSATISGNTITNYDLRVVETDFEEFEIKKVVIVEDELDLSALLSNGEDDED